MELLIWLENTGLSTAIRESEGVVGYTLLIILHGMGMGTVVGISTVIGLRLVGFVPALPIEPLQKFFPIIWLGFFVNAISGVLLMMAQATTLATNWVMYIKLGAVAFAIVSIRLLQTHAFGNSPLKWPASNVKTAAGVLLFLWAVAIIAGRLTAYYGSMIDPFDLIRAGLG